MSIKTVLDSKTVEELQPVALAADNPKVEELTDEKIELILKCLKYQNGCTETAGNEEFIGLGNRQIADKAGVSVEQVKEVKAARDAKLAPKDEVTEATPEITK